MSADHDPVAQRMMTENDPDAALSSALARLEASRQGLRRVMIPPPRPARPPRRPRTAEADGDASGTGATGGGLFDWLPGSVQEGIDSIKAMLHKHPISALMTDAVSGWWEHHPVRAAASVAGAEVSDAIAPLIRRHPVISVGLAAFLGAAVVTARPWRWQAFGGSARPLPKRVASWVAAQVPLQAMLGTLIALLADQARQAASSAAAERSAPAATPPSDPT